MRASKRQGEVLCAIDLTERSDEAIRQAAEVARTRRLKLTALHVLPDPLAGHPMVPLAGRARYSKVPEAQARAADAVRQQLERALGAAAAAVRVQIGHGAPHAVIVEQAEARRAELLVIGASASSVGREGERVVRYAHCPVLVARASSGSDTVLAATDLSDAALPAVAAAVERVRADRGRLVLLHVIDLRPFLVQPDISAGVAIPLTDGLREELVASARTRLSKALRRFRAKGELVVECGEPAGVILDQAEAQRAGLLVVGTSGATGLARMALGSVAEAVVRRSPCSTLVVRKHAARKRRSR